MKQNIADFLLDDTVDQDAGSAWEAEILLRLKEIDEGKTKLMPWSEARTKSQGNDVLTATGININFSE